MDKKIRELELRAISDPSVHEQLLAEYLRAGIVSLTSAQICASFGHPAAIALTNQPEIEFPINLKRNLPKKVFLALGLGALLELEKIAEYENQVTLFQLSDNDKIRLNSLLQYCEILRTKSIIHILNKSSETFDIPHHYNGITAAQSLSIISRELEPFTRFEPMFVEDSGRLFIPTYLAYYFSAHLMLARAANKDVGKRINECFQYTIISYEHARNRTIDTSPEIRHKIFEKPFEFAAKRQVFLVLLGPYLI